MLKVLFFFYLNRIFPFEIHLCFSCQGRSVFGKYLMTVQCSNVWVPLDLVTEEAFHTASGYKGVCPGAEGCRRLKCFLWSIFEDHFYCEVLQATMPGSVCALARDFAVAELCKWKAILHRLYQEFVLWQQLVITSLKRKKKSLKTNIKIRVPHRWFGSSGSSQDTLEKKPNFFPSISESITHDI